MAISRKWSISQEELSQALEEDNEYGETMTEKVREKLDDTPTDELVEAYNTKYESRPQPFSRNVLSAYVTVDDDEFEDVYGGDESNESFEGALEELGAIDLDELQQIRDYSLEYDSRADRAYLAAARIAQEIDESEQIDARDVVTADKTTSSYITRKVQEHDRKIRSQLGLTQS
ncbi:MAG: hypothetical protein ABEK04_05965 [Candidatus Nanohalobium sp.]